MSTGERIEEQSFCYDPDFPPEVPEGLPLSAMRPEPQDAGVKRVLRACAAAVKRERD